MFLLINLTIYSSVAYIASFNTLHLGWNRDKDYIEMAKILGNFDLVALQEVMEESALEELIEELEVVTNSEWEYNLSNKMIGSGEYKEYYAFIWKKDSVKLMKVLGFYKDTKKTFERPPYGVVFKIDNFDFLLINTHIVYGKNIRERQLEVLGLEGVYNYFKGLLEDEKDIIIAGDFNLSAVDPAFKNLKEHQDKIYYGVSPKNKTTIGQEKLSKNYDNILYSHKYTSEYTGKSGIINYTNDDFDRVRKSISDHLPVFIEVKTKYDDD